MKFPDFDDETKEKMRMVFQRGTQPKITSRDFGKMSDEKLDEFISNNSHTIHILAATAERKRRDDAKADEAEKNALPIGKSPVHFCDSNCSNIAFHSHSRMDFSPRASRYKSAA